MTNPFFSIATILVSLIFGFFYVRPAYTVMQGRRADLVVLDETFKNTKEIEVLIGETEKTLNGIDSKELERFSVFLPETTDAIRLANNIQRVAFSHTIAFEKVKVEEAKKEPAQVAGGVSGVAAGVLALASTPKYATTKTTLAFTTSNDSFRSFLADLEKSLGLMNITGLTFSPASESDKVKKSFVPQYQYVVALETYSLK